MGRSYTPTYRVEMNLPGFYVGGLTWSVKDSGEPTNENLVKYIDRYDEQGFIEGLPMVTKAWIVRQSTSEIVAEYHAPMFKIAA